MRADYDSEANTLQLVLEDFDRFPSEVDAVDIGSHVTVDAGPNERAYVITAQEPNSREASADLAETARRYGLDERAIVAATRAALAHPDHVITLEVAPA